MSKRNQSQSFEDRMLFGKKEERISTEDNQWDTKNISIFVQKFNQDHMRKFNARQQRLREKEEKLKNFPTSTKQKALSTNLQRVKRSKPAEQSLPSYATKMTNEDINELFQEVKTFSLQQIAAFFEGKVNEKVCFEGVPVTVVEVFPRSEGVAVKFFIRKTDVGQLTLSRSMNEQKKQRPVALVDIDGSGRTRLFGEIQGAINENFKVLFK